MAGEETAGAAGEQAEHYATHESKERPVGNVLFLLRWNDEVRVTLIR